MDKLFVGAFIFFSFLWVMIFSPFVFAQETTGFQEPLEEVFQWINEAIRPSIEDSDLENDTKTNLIDTLDSGTDAGIKGVGLWFGIHLFFVNMLFAGVSETDIPIDKSIIVIVSMILVFVLMIALVRKLFKENTKVMIIVVTILFILAILGIVIEF